MHGFMPCTIRSTQTHSFNHKDIVCNLVHLTETATTNTRTQNQTTNGIRNQTVSVTKRSLLNAFEYNAYVDNIMGLSGPSDAWIFAMHHSAHPNPCFKTYVCILVHLTETVWLREGLFPHWRMETIWWVSDSPIGFHAHILCDGNQSGNACSPGGFPLHHMCAWKPAGGSLAH